jgi:hypothetical protein
MLYMHSCEELTKARLNRALAESQQARLARLCQKPSEPPAKKRSVHEGFRAFLEWKGTIRVRLGPTLYY